LKRKFAELTDHSITSSLTDEEEWFGSEPKSGSQDTSRRFSGRMRFVGLDSPNMSSSPQIKRLSNENSLSRTPQRPSEPRKTEISPAVVLQAQNLVSAEILSEKLLHPPRTVGTGMDDLSHVAIQEGSLRPMSAGVGSNAGKRSIGERSFDVFMDEDKDLGAMENSVMEDVLPAELTRPSQAELWSVPAPSLPASERESPEVHEEKSEESEESESGEEEDQLNDVTRPDRPSLQLTDTPQVVSAASSPQGSEGSEQNLDAYDASGQLLPPNRRRYYQPDQQPSSEEEYSGSDDIDYEHPERFQDDEELSGQDYDEEDTLKHAGYYSQGRRVENEDEFYHSDEEDYSDEEEYESEEEKPVRGKVPVVVDLTLDSSDEEQSEEEDEDDKLELRGHTDEESESDDESEVSEEDEEEIEEEVEEEAEGEDQDEPEWTGIKSQTPATPFTDISHPSQEQIPQTHGLDVFLDPSLMASHPNIIESTQSHPFTFDPDLQLQSEAIALQHAPNFPPDLIAQALDPAMFQQPPQLDLTPLSSMDTHTASIMDTVLSFAQEHAAIDTPYSMDIPRIDAAPMMQDIQHQEKSFSEMMEEADAILHKHVDIVDSTAQQEFLMGILPMGNQERGEEATVEMQRGLTQDFLPNIVPDVFTDGENEAKGGEAGERKVRQESMVLESVEVRDKSTEESMQGAEVPQSVIPVEQPIAPLQEPQTIVQEQIIRVSETTKESTDIHGTTVVEQLLQEESTIITQHLRPLPAQEQQTTHEEQEEQPTSPAPQRSPSLEPLPEDWRTEGLTTPLAYFPPLADIVPPGLRAQKENRMVDVIGVIRTCGELSKTKGVDYVLPLHIVDPSTGTESGLSVLLFRPHKSALPENPERGSVIVLTDMKVCTSRIFCVSLGWANLQVQSFQHRAQVRTTESSGWILFPVNGEVEDSGPPVEYGKEEELMVKQLQHWWKRSLEKGKGKETNGVDGHVSVNGSANGRGVKNKAKRGGKKVNINRG